MSKRSQYLLSAVIGALPCAALALVIIRLFHLHSWWQVGFLLLAAKICGGGLGIGYTWVRGLGMPTEDEVERALASMDEPFSEPEDLVASIEEVRSRNGEGSPYFLPQPHQIRRHLVNLQKRGRVVTKHCHKSDAKNGYQPYFTFALRERVA
jgi:hypothetical protein